MKLALASLMLLFPPMAFAATSVGGSGLLQLLVYLIVIGLIFWVIWWFLGYVGVPEPFNKVLRVILGLVALIVVVNVLLGIVGEPLFRL